MQPTTLQVIRAVALRFHRLWFLLGGLLLAGCRTAAPPPTHIPPDMRERLMAAVARWRGTPHQWGGLDHQGIDCSGLVLRVYQEAFGLSLPRTTEAQAQLGRPVSWQALQAGDLVFFRFNGKDRHVGIYLGDGRFVHASSSQGVTISTLNDPYWRRHYWMARRILAHQTTWLPASSSKPTIGW